MRIVVNESAKRALRRFGLSEYEARAYLTFLESGPLPAKDLSGRAGVPFSKICSHSTREGRFGRDQTSG